MSSYLRKNRAERVSSSSFEHLKREGEIFQWCNCLACAVPFVNAFGYDWGGIVVIIYGGVKRRLTKGEGRETGRKEQEAEEMTRMSVWWDRPMPLYTFLDGA